MCGIFCYFSCNEIHCKKILHMVLTGLKTLEYRGYDSAGLYIQNGSHDIICKSVGNVDRLYQKTTSYQNDLSYKIGIGHTRWATHGAPSEKNTHPHGSTDHQFMVVHNGIITNYISLKMYLHDHHLNCVSDTDTEVIPLLYYKFALEYPNDNFLELTNRVMSVLEGSYAYCVVSKKFLNELVVVRKESPIIIGKSEDGFIISSDVNGLIAFGLHEAFFLENEDVVHLSEKGLKCTNDNEEINRSFEMIDSTYENITKGAYRFFMEKEIYEQPFSISMTLKHRIVSTNSNHNVFMPELLPHLLRFQNANRILLIACGSSWHACLSVRNYYEKIFKGKIIQIENACNLIDRHDFYLSERDILIFLSQSGETSDTLFCVREMKKRCDQILTVAITNMRQSSLARECEIIIYNNIGNEIGVASTKSYTSQILLLVMIALQFCEDQNHVNMMTQEIQQLPSLISNILSVKISEDMIRALQNCNNVLVLGRNEHYANALETALKLKEISYIHSEGLLADDLKHGPLAMLDSKVVVIVIASNDIRMHSTIQQLKARNARIIKLTDTNDKDKTNNDNTVIIQNNLTSVLRTILDIIPLQLLAFHVAIAKKINVDQPRHLAKSVTVSD